MGKGDVAGSGSRFMGVKFQLVVDVHDAVREASFWAEALGYRPEPPPAGFESWNAYYRRLGVPEEEDLDGADSIVDPAGAGPRIWFHAVPEEKVCKNRLHLDLGVSGGFGVAMELRRARVNAEADRLVRLGATRLESMEAPGVEWYAVAMADPEGNEFDIN
jgi:hypothetical protein